MKIQRITYLSLGTNQGNKLENLQKAIDLIDDTLVEFRKFRLFIKLHHGVLMEKISLIFV